MTERPAPRLRRDLNMITGFALPAWSEGPKGDASAIIAATRAEGYEGIQHFAPELVVAAGLPATGMGRVLAPAEADAIAARHKALGCEATTLHVGTGLETDAEMDRLAAAVVEAGARHAYPLFVETHRATITQDIRRTIDLVARFPELRFNADLSHYYTGSEMAYGDIAAKFDLLEPVFQRVRFLHGRISDPSAAQVMVEDDEMFASFQRCAELGALPLVHAENGDVVASMTAKLLAEGNDGPEGHAYSRPPEVEGEATNRAIMLADMAGVPLYVVHTSCEQAHEAIRRARQKGMRVYGEPLIQHLTLDESEYFNKDWDHAARRVMSPPFRN